MAGESRPACVYAVQNLKRNSTKLLIALCIGIALAMYGVYVQARASSNPQYQPTIAMATHWLYHNLGRTLAHPMEMMKTGCSKQVHKPNVIMRFLLLPAVRYSGVINGCMNLFQILLLKVYCKSLPATALIGAMSLAGFLISMVCLVGALLTCRLMCISCLGIHHLVIAYLAMSRYRIIQNLLCPPGNTSEGACSGRIFGSGGGSSSSSSNSASSGSQPDSMRRRNR